MVKNKQEKTIVALPKKVGHESAASVKKREKQPDRMIGENPRLTHFFQEIAHHIWPEKKRNRYRSTKTGFLSILRPCFFFWHIPGNGLKSSHLTELNNWWKKREEKNKSCELCVCLCQLLPALQVKLVYGISLRSKRKPVLLDPHTE